jgi:hypothetical protein
MIILIAFIAFEMSRSSSRSWNQILKGAITEGQHKLAPFVATVRIMLIKYEQLNQAIIDYINSTDISNDELKRLLLLPPEILQRVVYDDNAYIKIMNSRQ